MSDFMSDHIIVINVPVPKGSQTMPTTRTTARACAICGEEIRLVNSDPDEWSHGSRADHEPEVTR